MYTSKEGSEGMNEIREKAAKLSRQMSTQLMQIHHDEMEKLNNEWASLREKSDLLYKEKIEEITQLKEEIKQLKGEKEMSSAAHTKTLKRRNCVPENEWEKLKEENNGLYKTINTMMGLSCNDTIHSWVIDGQIDPKILMSNWGDFYEKDGNGKWICASSRSNS